MSFDDKAEAGTILNRLHYISLPIALISKPEMISVGCNTCVLEELYLMAVCVQVLTE